MATTSCVICQNIVKFADETREMTCCHNRLCVSCYEKYNDFECPFCFDFYTRCKFCTGKEEGCLKKLWCCGSRGSAPPICDYHYYNTIKCPICKNVLCHACGGLYGTGTIAHHWFNKKNGFMMRCHQCHVNNYKGHTPSKGNTLT
jgi:hypothetical protein